MLINNKWKYHLGIGFFILLMNFISDYGLGGEGAFLYNFSLKGLLYNLTFYSAFFLIYFINFKYICPKFLSKKKWLNFIIAILPLFLLFPGLRFFFEEVLVYKIIGTHNYYGASLEFKYYIFDNFYYALRPILYSTIIFLVFRFINAQSEIYQLKLNHKKAELSFLKSQISPHFLFNTLNTFYSELIDKEPETAKDVYKLSQLLRYVTYESHHDFMPLKKEISFINDYIYFFKKRFEDELYLDFEITGKIQDRKIPSLILIHFIENLFKHGVVNDKNFPAKISIDISEGFMTLKTKNKPLSSEKYMASGIGGENIKRRLTALFNSNYELSFSNKDYYFNAYLKIPL